MTSMIARYNGTCALCGKRFGAGTPILWARHTRETVHSQPAACKEQAAPQAPYVSRLTPADWDRIDKAAYAREERLAEQNAYLDEMEDEEWCERMADLAYSHADDLNNS